MDFSLKNDVTSYIILLYLTKMLNMGRDAQKYLTVNGKDLF